MWPYFAPKPLRGGASKGWKVKMCEGGPPSLSLGRLAELWRVIRMCPFYALNPPCGGASKGSGAWIPHAKGAKEYWLLQIRIGNRANDASRVAGSD